MPFGLKEAVRERRRMHTAPDNNPDNSHANLHDTASGYSSPEVNIILLGGMGGSKPWRYMVQTVVPPRIYIYIYIYVYTYTYIYIYSYIHIRICIHHIHVHVYHGRGYICLPRGGPRTKGGSGTGRGTRGRGTSTHHLYNLLSYIIVYHNMLYYMILIIY